MLLPPHHYPAPHLHTCPYRAPRFTATAAYRYCSARWRRAATQAAKLASLLNNARCLACCQHRTYPLLLPRCPALAPTGAAPAPRLPPLPMLPPATPLLPCTLLALVAASATCNFRHSLVASRVMFVSPAGLRHHTHSISSPWFLPVRSHRYHPGMREPFSLTPSPGLVSPTMPPP